MCPRLQATSAYKKELYAIPEAIKKWRQYLLGNQFRIFSYQQSLNLLLNQTIQTPAQQKYLRKLIGYNYQIFYKPGHSNVVVDALSRLPDNSSPVFSAISTPIPQILDQLRHFYTTHPNGWQLCNCLSESPKMQPVFSLKQGLLYFKEKIFVPLTTALQHPLLAEYHGLPFGGHSDVQATVACIATSFAWSGLTKDITDKVPHP